MKKVAIIGSHGVGKTSIAQGAKARLEGQGYRVEFLGELARQCPFQLNEESDFNAQFYMISGQVNEENKAALGEPDILITDRCILDSLIYWRWIRDKKMREFADQPENLRDLERKDKVLENIVRSWIDTYDAFVYVKVSDDTWNGRDQKDGVRNPRFGWYKDICAGFEKALKEYGLTVTEIHNDDDFFESVNRAVAAIRLALDG
jgi:nicotinamide riboside kinase